MDWPYTLIDWEWDAMSNGGNLDDAVKYIHSIGVKPCYGTIREAHIQEYAQHLAIVCLPMKTVLRNSPN